MALRFTVDALKTDALKNKAPRSRGFVSSVQCDNSFFFFVAALLLVLVALLLFLLLLLLLVAAAALLALLILLVLLTLLRVLLILLVCHVSALKAACGMPRSWPSSASNG